MTHAWYSNQHEMQCGCAIYKKLDGTGVTAATFVCKDKEAGEQYVKETFPQFPDYQYIGEVGEFVDNCTVEREEPYSDWSHPDDIPDGPLEEDFPDEQGFPLPEHLEN